MGSLVKIEYAAPVASESNPTVVAAAESLSVVDQASYEFAGASLLKCKAEIGIVNDEEEKIVPDLHRAHKAAKALFNKLRAPFEQAETIIKQKMITFVREQERTANARRIAAEAAAAEERARLEAEAEEALASGDVERSESLSNVAEVLVAPTISGGVQKVAGISTKKAWKAEVNDKSAFVAAAATNPMFLAALNIDEQKLAKLFAATEGAIQIPGVRGYQDDVMSARRAA